MGETEADLWSRAEAPQAREGQGESFHVDVAGYEGPLDLLLTLAKLQKVDLTRISVRALAEQYLAFVREARQLRLELAADYLVMAAWLAYLKSRLLLPRSEDEEPSGEDMAAALAFRLQRLGAMREAAVKLVNRNRLGRDVFGRGLPEGVRVERTNVYEASLYDLLKAYGDQRGQHAVRRVVLKPRRVVSLKDAREILERLVGDVGAWTPLDALLSGYLDDPDMRASAIASTFSASLEMCREGKVELRQDGFLAPLYLRPREENCQ